MEVAQNPPQNNVAEEYIDDEEVCRPDFLDNASPRKILTWSRKNLHADETTNQFPVAEETEIKKEILQIEENQEISDKIKNEEHDDIADIREESIVDENEPQKEVTSNYQEFLADHNYCNLSNCTLLLEDMISDYLKRKSLRINNYTPNDKNINEFVESILCDINKFQFDAADKTNDNNKNVMDFEEQVQNILDSVTIKAETNETELEEMEEILVNNLNETEIVENMIDEEAENYKLSAEQLELLEKLRVLGEKLQNNSQALLNRKDEVNEQEFKTFLSTALGELKELTISHTNCTEQSVQTDLSRKALRRLNTERKLQNKFETSSSTSSTDTESDANSSTSSSSSSCSNSSCSQTAHKKSSRNKIKIEKDATSQIEKIEQNGMPKSKKKSQDKMDLSEDESDVDSIDEDDKEIERLINFDGLLKRQKYNGGSQLTAKSTDILKLKTKPKPIDLLLAGSCSDETDTSSDSMDGLEVKAINEMEQDVTITKDNNGEDLKKPVEDEELDKEVITEKEFLKRYNDSLKNHFLNDSSSMSEDSVASGDEILKNLKEDEENCDILVDKFLETYSPEQDDEDEDEVKTNDHDKSSKKSAEDDEQSIGEQEESTENTENQEKRKALKSSLSEFIKLPKSPSRITENHEPTVEKEKAETENKNNEASSSDCEVLNETNLLNEHPKQPKAAKKSFETMLSEAEKRNKKQKVDASDLISLSSDSTSSSASDAETVDGEQSKAGQQSRVIKPMLRQDQLASETRRAQKSEADRIRRLEKKQNMLAKVLKEKNKNSEGNTEAQTELILDYNSETKTFIKVHPDIVKHLKSHQFDGIKFMYDSCYGGVDALKKSQGSGCILAHCMGLGKTLQLIALLHTVISYKELKTSKILVLCPKSTVMNWNDEIIRWLGPLHTTNLKVFTFNDTSDVNEKLKVMREWSQSNFKRAGCLLVGYEAFRSLVFYHSYKNRNNYGSNYMEDIRERVEKYLLKPGADLVVCDEGHIIKNSKSAISMAVSKITTPKRIVLTGTPIQNNLKEYYSMVNFIKPLFLGTEKEFANLYANPIKNGQHKDSSKRDIKVMKQRSFVLHKKLSKFVQRKEAELLKTFLPKKFEYVLFIPMTDVQNNLYERILEALARREESRGRGLIMDYTCLRKIWTHPKVLEDAWLNATNQKSGKKDFVRKPPSEKIGHSDDDQPDDIYDSQTGLMSVTNDWWRHLLTERDLQTIMPSNKLRTMFEILRMCEEKDEKCLIFSAFVAVLNVVEFFFKKITQGDPETLKELNIAPSSKLRNKWVAGQDYYRLDGKTAKNLRHEMVIRFNDPANRQARVFLISAKAGGQGINLIGANRVIILDTSWNPSNDQQNIFRIFRLGQKRICYIYRLLAMGTMEEKVYSRSVTKQAMSFRVVDEQQIDRHYSMAELAELYTLTKPNIAERPMPIFPQDSILASLLLNFPEMVFKYHEHDSLLENKVEQELSEQEKADAWAAYERDLQITSESQEPNMEGLKNAYGMAPYFRNPYGPLGGIDMQTILNYTNLANTASTSPYIQTLLSQYTNFPATNQQHYMDVLNMYSKYAQSSMGFSDLNPLAATSPFANTANSVPNLPGKPTLPGNASSPLSALGDLTGFYGMAGLGKSFGTTNPATSSSNPTSSMFMQRAPPTTESMLFPPSFNAKSTSAYPTQYPHTGLYNFGSEYTPPSSTNVMNLNFPNSSGSSMHLTNTSVPPPPSTISLTTSGLFPTPLTVTSTAMSTLNSNKSQKNNTATNNTTTTTSRMEYSSSNPPPLVDLTKPANQSTTTVSNTNKKGKNETATNKTVTTSSASLPRAHPVSMSVASASKHNNGKNLTSKLNNEMLIIPTTSPPGPTSISKQFSDISPSISLTALKNTPTLTPINTTNMQSNKNLKTMSSSTFLPLANGKSTTKSITSTTATTTTPITSTNSKSPQVNQVIPPLNKTTPKIKVANFANLSRQTNSTSPANNTTNNVRKLAGTPTKFVNNRTTSVTTTTTSTTPTANKRQAYPPLANLSYSQQKKPNTTSTTLTPAQLQRLRSFGAPTGSGSVATKNSNEISIRPMDSKANSTAGDNVYIIETNINDKRVAIGAPTRSGNGTTVTKITNPVKRKNVDVLQMERKKAR